MAYYQSVAENPEATENTNNLPKADAYVAIAAHAGRARILTECLDPSIYLLSRGSHPQEEKLLEKYDLYANNIVATNQWTSTYLKQFRQAQIDRNDRISKYALNHPNASFVVNGTMMDPRWIDVNIDPNDRTENMSCYLGNPKEANDSITGLARFSSSESWLSQWSWSHSKGDGVYHASRITVPTLFIENGADNGVPYQHIHDMFNACSSQDKEYYKIDGATHYYTNQKDKLSEAAHILTEWLKARGFVSIVTNDDNNDKKKNERELISNLQNIYDGKNAMEINGINHLALVSSDMERTCRFYGGVLGLRLSKTIALPNGGQHFFFDLNGHHQSMAFFWFPNAPPANPGSSAPDPKALMKTGEHPSAQGSMNHVAFNVPEKKLKEYRKRLVKSDLCSFVTPIVYHADTEMGYEMKRNHPNVTWASVYFFGPDGELLEISSQIQSFEEDRNKHVKHLPQKSLWKQTFTKRGKL